MYVCVIIDEALIKLVNRALLEERENLIRQKRLKMLSMLSFSPRHAESLPFSFSASGEPKRAFDSAGTGVLGLAQGWLKRFGILYGFMVDVFGPCAPLKRYSSQFVSLLNAFEIGSVILNYGCGPRPIDSRPDIINIDIFPFKCVDLVVDPGPLPIRSSSVDLVLSIAVLEHVEHPRDMVDDMYRLLKPAGKVFCFVPFMQPIHSAPGDFRRWTPEGLKNLFSDFKSVRISVASGPSSSLAWILAVWMASFLSLGSKRLFDLTYLLCLPLVSPLKLVDRLFPWMGNFPTAASGFLVTCSKD